MTHTIGWRDYPVPQGRDKHDAGWWREAIDRNGGPLHHCVLSCTCGWLSVTWTVEYAGQWQEDAERHGRTHDGWQWAEGMATIPSPQTLPGVPA